MNNGLNSIQKRIGKFLKDMFVLLLLVSCTSCGTATTTPIPEFDETIYLRCNQTSFGNMAETETHFFYLLEDVLYCIKKEDIKNGIVTEYSRYSCANKRASMTEMIQKDNKIYTSCLGNDLEIQILELLTGANGKESEVAYTITLDMTVNSFRGVLMDNQFVFYYGHSTDHGTMIQNLARLEEDGTVQILFTREIEDEQRAQLTMPAYFQCVRGDMSVISSLLTEDGEDYFNVLWRMEGDEPERIHLPEDVSIVNSYLRGNTFTYFTLNEGFHMIDLTTNEEFLLFENQLSYSRGYRLSDEYFVECNRYGGYMPDEAKLLIFNGKKWTDVELPEEVKKTDGIFYPLSVASDRMFFIQKVGKEYQLYYCMLEEKEPKLVCCLVLKSKY